MQFVKPRAVQVVTADGWKWAVTSYGVTTHGDHLPSTVDLHHEKIVNSLHGDRKAHKETFPHLYNERKEAKPPRKIISRSRDSLGQRISR